VFIDTMSTGFTGGGDKREYIYFAGRRIAMVDLSVSGTNCQGTPPDCARYYFYPDHLGSTSVLASAGGTTTLHDADYYPFGGERIFTSSSIDPHYRFTGKERDGETGLDYFGARFFGNVLGRFLSPDDTLNDQHEEDPKSWNLYSYVRNNPLSNTDPSGQECVTIQDANGNDVVGDDGQGQQCGR
jgi:RHS repeat-associated protein